MAIHPILFTGKGVTCAIAVMHAGVDLKIPLTGTISRETAQRIILHTRGKTPIPLDVSFVENIFYIMGVYRQSPIQFSRLGLTLAVEAAMESGTKRYMRKIQAASAPVKRAKEETDPSMEKVLAALFTRPERIKIDQKMRDPLVELSGGQISPAKRGVRMSEKRKQFVLKWLQKNNKTIKELAGALALQRQGSINREQRGKKRIEREMHITFKKTQEGHHQPPFPPKPTFRPDRKLRMPRKL